VQLPISSQLTAGYWQNDWLVGWLVVSRVCLSRVSQSVRARFGHISETSHPINFVFGVRQRAARPENVWPACVSTPGEARQRRVYNAIRVDSVPSCKLGPARTRPRVINSNLGPILLRFRDIAGFLLRKATPPLIYSTQILGCSCWTRLLTLWLRGANTTS